MSIVLPGERAPAQHVNLKLGPGLLQAPNGSSSTNRTAPSIFATRAGTLNHSANGSKWWVESNARRYVPAAQESVVGVVVQKQGEGFRVDIGSAHSANLDGLAFEGATKRNKPNLKVARDFISLDSNGAKATGWKLAHKDMEPELECFDAQTRKAEGFGELKGGFLVRCSLRLCRQLLDPKHFLLPLLGSLFPLEIAVGLNGRIWINSQDAKRIIAIAQVIEAADPDAQGMGESDIRTLLEDLNRKWMFESCFDKRSLCRRHADISDPDYARIEFGRSPPLLLESTYAIPILMLQPLYHPKVSSSGDLDSDMFERIETSLDL
ncbi:hypothetical protein EV361DRAFT_867277 [Lentinula raphanica]|nr:hypothetical protein EV361DRAFT_867277 [Lentinula raphanica]